MAELHDSLDREARRIRAEDHALASVQRRARRMRNSRRVASGAMALAVAAAGILFAVSTFDAAGEDPRPRPAQPAPAVTDLPPIWPIGSTEEIDHIQQEVDEGHQPWYLSPRIVAQVFAMEVLHWNREDIEASVRGDDPVTVVIANPRLAEAAGAPADLRTTLTMKRWRDREDGILVVTRANSEAIALTSPSPGEAVGPDDSVVFTGELGFVPEAGGFEAALFYRMTSAEFLSTNVPSSTRIRAKIEEVPQDIGFAALAIVDEDQEILAATAFPLAGTPSVSESPTPGPTPTSDGATPAAIPIQLIDASGEQDVLAYTEPLLSLLGRDTHHGGYVAASTGKTEQQETTTIFCAPENEAEAARLRDRVFPDGDIEVRVPPGDPDIVVVMGRDHVARHEEGLAAFRVADGFMTERLRGEGAEIYLSEEARDIYEREEGGISLYGYTAREGAHFEILGVYAQGSQYRAGIKISQEGSSRSRHESLVLERGPANSNLWLVVYAERNE